MKENEKGLSEITDESPFEEREYKNNLNILEGFYKLSKTQESQDSQKSLLTKMDELVTDVENSKIKIKNVSF